MFQLYLMLPKCFDDNREFTDTLSNFAIRCVCIFCLLSTSGKCFCSSKDLIRRHSSLFVASEITRTIQLVGGILSEIFVSVLFISSPFSPRFSFPLFFFFFCTLLPPTQQQRISSALHVKASRLKITRNLFS